MEVLVSALAMGRCDWALKWRRRDLHVTEIQGFLAEMYGTEVTPEFISRTVLNNTATVIGDNTNPATDSGSQGCKNSRPIPTMSPLGLALLILLLAATAVVVLRKRYR